MEGEHDDNVEDSQGTGGALAVDRADIEPYVQAAEVEVQQAVARDEEQ